MYISIDLYILQITIFEAGDTSGQIIATSHDLTPNGGLARETPLFQGNLGWWNIISFGQKNLGIHSFNLQEVYLSKTNPPQGFAV